MEFKEFELIIEKLESQKANTLDVRKLSVIDNEINRLKLIIHENMTAMDRVFIARNIKRPKSIDYINSLFTDFIEMHGDRHYKDDKAIIGGIGFFKGIPVTVVGLNKGKNIDENIERNFGMSNPEGYRKVLRLVKQAEKFKRIVITFVDTAGAFCGKGAEERGQAEAIAKCLYEFSSLKTIVICVVVGEGGSGGALALSVGDKIIMLENAVYSILSPEGFSSILWKDETRAKEASELMKLTSFDLKEKGIVDYIVKEPIGGAQYDFNFVIKQLEDLLDSNIKLLSKEKINNLVSKRYNKYRKIGIAK